MERAMSLTVKDPEAHRLAQAIARETGAVVVEYMPSVGGVKEITNYFQLFDYNIGLLTKAFQGSQ